MLRMCKLRLGGENWLALVFPSVSSVTTPATGFPRSLALLAANHISRIPFPILTFFLRQEHVSSYPRPTPSPAFLGLPNTAISPNSSSLSAHGLAYHHRENECYWERVPFQGCGLYFGSIYSNASSSASVLLAQRTRCQPS